MRSAFLLTVVTIGLGAASPALADDNAVSISVGTRDLDLSQPGDAARLRSRLARAAGTACVHPGTRSVAEFTAFNACKSAALGSAELRAERAIAAAARGGGRIQTARR